MPALHELQRTFAAAVFGDATAAERLIAACADRRGAVAGLAAYRRSVLANLAGAVRATYPVVENIVGPDFMAAACRRYAATHASRRGDLNAYGGDFAELLAGAAPSLPYLPDVARLEWLVLQVDAAPEAPRRDLSRLAARPPESWGELRFAVDPAQATLTSDWPLEQIWRVNQPAHAGDYSVDFATGARLLIHRRATGIAVETLDAGEQALLIALIAGRTLADAVDRAIAEAARFDLQATLRRFIDNGLLRQAY